MSRRPNRRRRTRAGRGYAAAQARLLAGIVAGYDPPLLGTALRAVTGRPRVRESSVGGVPATVARPARGDGPWPTVVLLPGVTRRGRAHPAFQGLARAFAVTGHLAVVVEPEGISVGELTSTGLRRARGVVEAVASRSDARGRRIALAGVSGGATVALLVAADPSLAERVSGIVVLAPCCDLEEALRFVTTGVRRDGDVLVPFASGDFFKLVIARCAVGWLPPGKDREVLRSHLLSLDDYGPDPLGGLRAWPRDELTAPARAVLELLSNDDPLRFDDLIARLPAEIRADMHALSPLAGARRIVAPVELVVPRADKYIPLEDSLAFAEACPSARLTILESLEHAVPTISVTGARDLAQLNGVFVRFLRESYSGR
ncbi:MAG: alpha/beta hydrolase [Actinobacteria bacterium]|nr:alpha/beta hydrolase [Actinomycetota bacterium]